MPGTPTTNYGWTVPSVNGDASSWGTELNADLEAIDAQVYSNAQTAASATAAVSSALTAAMGPFTGMVAAFLGAAPSTLWLPLDGSLVSRTTYAALWAYAQASGIMEANDAAWLAEQTTNGGPVGKFSPGDGSTTFRLPDIRGTFLRAWADGAAVDSGRANGSFQADAFQGHWHATPGSMVSGGSTSISAYSNGTRTDDSTGTLGPITDGTHGTPRVASETRPLNVAALYCIHL